VTQEGNRFGPIPFFRGFPDEDLEHLLQFASEVEFEPGDAIFRQGDPGRELYVVTAGNVRFDRLAADGKMRVLSTARFGAVFGELAFLQPQPRTATAIAVEKTSLLIFQKAEIQKLLDLYPSLAAAFYHAVALEIARRLRESAP
jgi:CRP/FNR family transcriptional regulator, cyclic AMP receptor protein